MRIKESNLCGELMGVGKVVQVYDGTKGDLSVAQSKQV
jgi:hypothetical protein